jgi:hypothetical protein
MRNSNLTTRSLAGLLLFASTATMAQRPTTGVLVGRVMDAQTGAPLAGVELVFAQKRVTSDSAGEYRFEEVPGGVHAITLRRLGYEQLKQDVSVITGAESDADFRLKRIVTLDTVETKAAATTYRSPALRGFEERRKMGNGHFLPEETMRKNDDRTLGNTLKRIPGIRTVEVGGSEYVSSSRRAGSGSAGAMRTPTAGRNCFVAVYLDGLAIYTGPPAPPPDMSRMLVRDLAAAEFYQGSASLPVQFSAIKTSDCGVLLLWSREN